MDRENLTRNDECNSVGIRVRYADVDQMGVAYNGIYLTWFEVGRTELLRGTGLTYHEVEASGVYLPLREAGVKYLKPIRYDDVLYLETTIAWQKGVRIRFHYEICRDNDTVSTGFTEHVFTDKQLRPIKPPTYLQNLHTLLVHQSGKTSNEGILQ